MQFAELTRTPDRFFKLLPKDWSVEIAPIWDQYALTGSRIFGVLEDDKVMAGGIVFNTVSPDTMGYESIAQSWFDRGYLYIAFLFVSPDARGKGLGSFWINELRNFLPNQHFWLAIEEHSLIHFYLPLGFESAQEVRNNGQIEWILTDERKDS